MNDEMQALCFMAGANSIFYGERLLTTDNPEANRDRRLFERLGLTPLDPRDEASDEAHAAAWGRQLHVQQVQESGLYHDAMARPAKQVLPTADHG